MSKLTVEDTSLVSVADAIRAKGGTTGALVFPDGFVSAIEGIKSGGNLAKYVERTATEIGEDYFEGCTKVGSYALSGFSVTSVTIPSTIKTIGGYVGAESAITQIELLDGLTTLEEYAFRDMRSLTSIVIPKSVTNFGKGTFYGCSSLADVSITNWPSVVPGSMFLQTKITSMTIPSGVTELENGVFYSCRSLTSIDIPSTVKTIGSSCFEGCSALTSIVLPEGLTILQLYLFRKCTKLTSINIPSSVNSYGSECFASCSALESITLPEVTSDCSLGKYMFQYCSKLTSVNIPEKTKSVPSYCFSGCSALPRITIPSTVTQIYDYAFSRCSALTTVEMKPTTPPTLSSTAFSNCSKLTTIIVPAGTLSAYQSATNWSAHASKMVERWDLSNVSITLGGA